MDPAHAGRRRRGGDPVAPPRARRAAAERSHRARRTRRLTGRRRRTTSPGHRLGRPGPSRRSRRRPGSTVEPGCRWTVRCTRPSSGSGPSMLTTPRPSSTPACTSSCSAAFPSGHPPLARRPHRSRGLRRQHRRAVPGTGTGDFGVWAWPCTAAPSARRLRPGGGRNPPGVPVEPRPAAGRRGRRTGPAGPTDS